MSKKRALELAEQLGVQIEGTYCGWEAEAPAGKKWDIDSHIIVWVIEEDKPWRVWLDAIYDLKQALKNGWLDCDDKSCEWCDGEAKP